MISTRNIVLFIFLTALFTSCTNNDLTFTEESRNKQNHIYQELLNIEYALLTSEYELVKDHSASLDLELKEGYNLFCPEESAMIDGARLTNHLLVQNIQDKEDDVLLDELRILKSTILNLTSDEDYDPYFLFLWRFEEDMDLATKVAMDPMLDLYEWNEFSMMVDCMNDSWQTVEMHRPSLGILNHDESKFKNQSLQKIVLDNAVDNFNIAVSQIDYRIYPLCEMAEGVREAYVKYIHTFIQESELEGSFMAKL